MYVCVCNAIKDSELRDIARRGVRSADYAYEALGCEPHCATCIEYVQAVLDDENEGEPAAL